MTAEVAILSKSAIAVAADSAVTRGQNKVHVSANKIFQLHKKLPIGIIVYNIDGFIWIKRKHYFDFSLNRAFYSRYHEKRFALGEHDDANKEG